MLYLPKTIYANKKMSWLAEKKKKFNIFQDKFTFFL
jgi:hypothetical protein